MKRHDNTLYVTTQGTYIARQRDTLLLRLDDQTRRQFPIHTLGGIVAFGNVSFSPFALGLCGESGVSVSMMTEHGRFLARVEGPISGNVLLRRAQYKASDSPAAASEIARALVAAKIANARTVLLRAQRDHAGKRGHSTFSPRDSAPDDELPPEQSSPPAQEGQEGQEKVECPLLHRAAARMAAILDDLRNPMSLEEVRGREGEAAQTYFGVFDRLIVAQKEDFRFDGRSRRPPKDRVNAVMSFLSAMLTHDARSACETVGLDPQVGFLHRDRPGRASLALDLMEELRPVLVDRLTLSLINRKQVAPDGFRVTESGGVEMDDATRKAVIVAWQARKNDELTHPFLNEKVSLGLLLHVQARLLARHLRGDLDAYPAFFWR